MENVFGRIRDSFHILVHYFYILLLFQFQSKELHLLISTQHLILILIERTLIYLHIYFIIYLVIFAHSLVIQRATRPPSFP